jgi:uncharacterized protein (DUF362 family)
MKKKSSRYTRREFVQLGVGLAAGAPIALATGCGGGDHHTPPPAIDKRADAKVALVQCRTYGTELTTAMQHASDLLGGLGSLVRGKIVTVKVNLTCSGGFQNQFGVPPGESYVTDGRTAIALASVLFAQGATKIRFVDSVPILDTMSNILASAGWDMPALLALGNVEVENTRNLGNGSAYAQLNVPGGGYLFDYFLLNHSYQDTDVFVSLAKMKQHTTAGITLSMKNLFGTTPNSKYGNEQGSENALGWRSPLHGDGTTPGWTGFTPPGARADRVPMAPAGFRIPRILSDLNAARRVHLAVVDGITSMTLGEGPWVPNAAPISPGVLLMGLNAVSTDAVAMSVMGYSPSLTTGTHPFLYAENHILLADQFGTGSSDLSKIDLYGLTIAQALCPFPLAGGN